MRPFLVSISLFIALAAAAPAPPPNTLIASRQGQAAADQPQDCLCDEKQCLLGPPCCRNGSCPPGTRYLRVPVKE